MRKRGPQYRFVITNREGVDETRSAQTYCSNLKFQQEKKIEIRKFGTCCIVMRQSTSASTA